MSGHNQGADDPTGSSHTAAETLDLRAPEVSGRPRPEDVYAVVGGGIAGLVAARSLARAGGRVVLLEASDRLGGNIRTDDFEGLPVDAGPDSFVARDRVATGLCEELGLDHELIAPTSFGGRVWIDGHLRPLPPGFVLGVPTHPLGLVRGRILSPQGAVRALGDLVLPGRLRGPDVSMGLLVRRRFGPDVLERLVDPILAGTRAGDPDVMSLAAAAPEVDAVARRSRSVMIGFMRARGSSRVGPPPFLGLRSGMESLVRRLRDDLSQRVEIRTSTSVDGIAAADGFYRVQHGGGEVAARGIVVATPAYAAARMVAGLSSEAAAALGGIDYASVGIITLLYRRGAVRLPRGGSGILVPRSQRRMLVGCTWTSRKWPHLAPPDGGTLLRCFVGRAGEDPALELDDDSLAERAHAEVAEALGIRAHPRAARVTRWLRAIPQYAVGHNEHIDLAELALRTWPGIALAGAAYRGSGLSDCIAQGLASARRVLDDRTRY